MSSGTPDNGAAAALPARWPDDAPTRRALEEFLRAGTGDTEPFAGIDMDFRGAVLDGIVLDGAWLNGARFDGVGLRRAELYDVRLNGASLQRADLTGALLRKSVLDDADARDAVLDEADLTSTEAFGTDLRGASLRRTQWAGALLKCDMRGADLGGAVFDETAMRGCRLAGATVTGARGTLFGPIDVGDDQPLVLEGGDLARWFHDRGAVDVVVLEPAGRR